MAERPIPSPSQATVTDPTVLVTGAASGIGAAVVDALREYLMAILAPMGPTLHTTTNSLEIGLDEDGRITSEHVGFAEHAVGDELVEAALTYRHTYARDAGGGLRITYRAIEPWYFARASDLHRHYGSRRAFWWQGTPPPTLPESSAAWQAFHGPSGAPA